MARRLLTARLAALSLLLGACGRSGHAPAPSAAASASASQSLAFEEDARAAHFASELRRANERWKSKPDLAKCPTILHEEGDAELCRAASAALSAIEQLDPNVPPETWLPVLSEGSLALARLSERTRFQSLRDIGQKHLTGDAGAPPASASRATPKPSGSKPASLPLAPRDHQRALELGESPSAQFLPVVLRLERDALRNLSAYLEYAPLPVRKASFQSVKKLSETHPQWALLDHLIREAALLERDRDLRQALTQLSLNGLPRGKRETQPGSPK